MALCPLSLHVPRPICRGGFGAAELDLGADTAVRRADHGRTHAERGVQAHRVHADRIATFALFGIERIWIQRRQRAEGRSEEHTSELQSPMRRSYAVFCFNKRCRTTTDHRAMPRKHDDHQHIRELTTTPSADQNRYE